jgi:hypothetical protein
VTAAAAQESVPRVVAGRVLRPDSAGDLRPVPGVWVVLHRVGSDTAGPLDSTRASRAGAFRFRYRSFGEPDAIYFVSASHDGIAYFGPPLRARETTGVDADVLVYDTTAAPIPLHVRGRHLVVGAPGPDGAREIVEVFEIANDTSVTRISSDGRTPTWFTVLPPGATGFQVGQGDVAPQTIREDSGRVVVTAPFAPGLKQLSFAYKLPPRSFPASYPMTDATTVMEVLLEEPSAIATAPKVARVDPVNVEGRSFARYLGQDLPASAVVRVSVPSTGVAGSRTMWIAIIVAGAAAVLLTAAVAARRWHLRRGTVAADVEGADAIARTIAALDERFARETEPSSDQRAAYAREREALKTRLASALARERVTS